MGLVPIRGALILSHTTRREWIVGVFDDQGLRSWLFERPQSFFSQPDGPMLLCDLQMEVYSVDLAVDPFCNGVETSCLIALVLRLGRSLLSFVWVFIRCRLARLA
jgi:hypothetical protein